MKRLIVFVCAVCWVQDGAAQSLALTNARILDGTGRVIQRGSVVIHDGRIASVAPGAPSAAGTPAIDVQGNRRDMTVQGRGDLLPGHTWRSILQTAIGGQVQDLMRVDRIARHAAVDAIVPDRRPPPSAACAPRKCHG